MDGKLEFFNIPDGRASKARLAAVVPTATKAEVAPPVTKMYQMEKVYGDDVKADGGTKMYKVENVYKA